MPHKSLSNITFVINEFIVYWYRLEAPIQINQTFCFILLLTKLLPPCITMHFLECKHPACPVRDRFFEVAMQLPGPILDISFV